MRGIKKEEKNTILFISKTNTSSIIIAEAEEEYMATETKSSVVKVRPSGNPIGSSSKGKNIPPSSTKNKITTTVTKNEVPI